MSPGKFMPLKTAEGKSFDKIRNDEWINGGLTVRPIQKVKLVSLLKSVCAGKYDIQENKKVNYCSKN